MTNSEFEKQIEEIVRKRDAYGYIPTTNKLKSLFVEYMEEVLEEVSIELTRSGLVYTSPQLNAYFKLKSGLQPKELKEKKK